MKEFESYYRREQLKEFWHHFKPVTFWLIPMIVISYIFISRFYYNDIGDLENYIGEVKGTVTNVYQEQIALDNPRIRRKVRIEIENGDFKVMSNDTLNVDDVIVLSHWKTTTGKDYYGY